jgi:hypothetical protein
MQRIKWFCADAFYTGSNNYNAILFNCKIFISMGNLLYLIAIVLVVIWLISFLGGFYTGSIIHSLLVIAVIAVIWRLIAGR